MKIHVFIPNLIKSSLYTWSDSVVGLKTGTRSADMAMRTFDDESMPLSEVKELQKIIDEGFITHLLIQATTSLSDLNEKDQNFKGKRQLVRLGNAPSQNSQNKAVAMVDPMTNDTLLRVWWDEPLSFNICPGDAFLFHGNILPVYQGETKKSIFKEVGIKLNDSKGESYFERTPWGTVCRISEPVLFKETAVGGEVPAVSTLRVSVTAGLERQEWTETPDLIHST